MTSLTSRVFNRVRRSIGLPPDRIEAAVQLFGGSHPDAFFVQIGANDGYARDPLRIAIERRRWRGIMVEPVPYVFKRLHERYGTHPRITLEEAAIADQDGILPFYHLREAAPEEEVWPWYHTLGSFKAEVVLAHERVVPNVEDRLVETEVASLTFASLCAKHGVDEVDVLMIDTEGYDYEILRSVDLTAWRPRLVVYEHYHLSSQDRAAGRHLLESNGYVTFEHGLDTAALDITRLEPADRRLRAFFEQTPDQPASR